MSTSHPSAETVSDLVEGLLATDEALAVEGHLAACAECRDVRDALFDVRTLLGDLPSPRMPAEAADRVDRALAAEPAGGPVDLAAHRRRRRHVLTGVGAAAAALVLVMAGGLAVLRGVQTSGEVQGASAKAGRSQAESGPAERGGPPVPLSARAPEYVTVTGRHYDRRSLERDVPGLLEARRSMSFQGGAGAPDVSGRLADPQALRSCLSGLARTAPAAPPAPPLAVDLATYEGEPAAVVVYDVPDTPGELDVWVVAAGCTAGAPHVLAHERVSRR